MKNKKKYLKTLKKEVDDAISGKVAPARIVELIKNSDGTFSREIKPN